MIDWNDCLIQALRLRRGGEQRGVYAAMVMIDPFTCWEDLADLLTEACVPGVINFPPSSIIQYAAAGRMIAAGHDLEFRRLEWFAHRGFRALFATSRDDEVAVAENCLQTYLDGILHVPPEALESRIGDEVEFLQLDDSASAEHTGGLPVFELMTRRG